MTTQELEQTHGPLVGRTGRYFFPLTGASVRVTITGVDHALQCIEMRRDDGFPNVYPDANLVAVHLAWDPLPSNTQANIYSQTAMSPGHPLDPGDIVRFVAASGGGFTRGKEYVIRHDQRTLPQDRVGVEVDDTGSPNGWKIQYFEYVRSAQASKVVFSSSATLQRREGVKTIAELEAKRLPPAHTCSENMKHYDSGWSAYNYCTICDKKEI